jgi:hypothetical protein
MSDIHTNAVIQGEHLISETNVFHPLANRDIVDNNLAAVNIIVIHLERDTQTLLAMALWDSQL